jgi:hypothetical protein
MTKYTANQPQLPTLGLRLRRSSDQPPAELIVIMARNGVAAFNRGKGGLDIITIWDTGGLF